MRDITSFAGFEVVWQAYLLSCARFKIIPALLRVGLSATLQSCARGEEGRMAEMEKKACKVVC